MPTLSLPVYVSCPALKIGVVLLSLLTLSHAGWSQQTQRSRQGLEREKRQNLEKMNQIQTILKKTRSEKQVGLGQLQALNQEIQTQSKQIGLLNKDIRLTESEITELRQTSKALTNDLNKLKAEYGSMVYAADRRRQQVNPLGFLFASDNFNQLVARYRYLRQYSDARQSQVRQMNRVQAQLQDKQQTTQRKREAQRNTLTVKVEESKKLETLKGEKDQVVRALSQKEEELRAELTESRQAIGRLEAMITRIVLREARERAEREARERAERARIARAEAARRAAERKRAEEAIAAAKQAGEKPAPADIAKVERPAEAEEADLPRPDERRNNNLNSAETALASSFSASRARLPWPVNRGFISDRFGRRAHPVLRGIYVDNQGIDIQTNAGETVRSVYDAVVQDVTNIPGMGNVVAIQHGNYFTVYAKLRSPSVQVGQRVKAREPIGVVSTNKNGVSELQFQIWRDINKLNPESWLSPR